METNNKNSVQRNQSLQDDFGKFPFTITTQWAYIGGEWTKLHTIYNANEEPVNTLPRTKEELVAYTQTFLELVESL